MKEIPTMMVTKSLNILNIDQQKKYKIANKKNVQLMSENGL